jgi:carbonic anhydrase
LFESSPIPVPRVRRHSALDPSRTLLISCFDAALPLEQLGLSVQGMQCTELRSPAHLIAPWNEKTPEEGASILLSLAMRETHDIVICGHVGCKALEAFLDEDRGWRTFQLLQRMPAAAATIDLVRQNYAELGGEEIREVLAQENVLTQVEHLLTYPLASGGMGPRVHAWLYDERDALLWTYSFEDRQFSPCPSPGRSECLWAL